MNDISHERRDFLKTISGGVGAAIAGAVLLNRNARAEEKLAPAADGGKKIGIALVGLGNLSTNQIAPALLKTKNVRLAGIVTGTPAKVKVWQDKYGIADKNVYNYETFDKIADNPEIDAIYIVLPNAMHAEYTIRAAKAGKHVLCEKPMEVSVKKCEEMIEACKKANRVLAIGYRCQFQAHHMEMMRLAREKTFGPVKLIEASFGFKIGDPAQWRLRRNLAGGGALMDVGIYALQAARCISGEEPVEVCATETKTDAEKFAEVDESIVWSLKFPSGVIANCGTTYAVSGMNRAWAGAEKGWFELAPAYNYTGIKGRTSKGEMDFAPTDQFAVEMDDFADCVINNKPTKVPGEEGLRDVKILMAIYKSIEKGGKPVKL